MLIQIIGCTHMVVIVVVSLDHEGDQVHKPEDKGKSNNSTDG